MATEPSEILTGLRRIFSIPAVYRFAQRTIGADKFRDALVGNILSVKAGDRILDIGCGTADILEHLPNVDYVGFDHSESYVHAAKERFGDRGRFINVAAGDVDLAQFGDRDLAMSVGVLHHLNDDEAREALQTAKDALGVDGRFVSVDPTVAPGQHPIGKFLAMRDRGQHVRTPDQIEQLVGGVFENVTVTVRHDLLRVPYSHVLVEARAA